LVSRDLDEQIGPSRGGMKRTRGIDRPLRVIGKERRHFERDLPIDAFGPVVDRPEQIPACCRSAIASLKNKSSRATPFIVIARMS
jgi:hypothetical protein